MYLTCTTHFLLKLISFLNLIHFHDPVSPTFYSDFFTRDRHAVLTLHIKNVLEFYYTPTGKINVCTSFVQRKMATKHIVFLSFT